MITFITGNPAKSLYLKDYFDIEVDHKRLDLTEIQSLSLEDIVRDKALRAQAEVGGTVLVEDVSLSFNALNTLPGPLIKWFFEALGNVGLCNLIPPGTTREATAEVMYALCDGTSIEVFKSLVNGTVTDVPRGDTNFGWDPIFIPLGHVKTWAEMTPDEKHETSMRKPALEALDAFLKSQSQ